MTSLYLYIKKGKEPVQVRYSQVALTRHKLNIRGIEKEKKGEKYEHKA